MVKILKFFDADTGSGMEKIRIRDGKKSDPGSEKTSWIRNTFCYNLYISNYASWNYETVEDRIYIVKYIYS